jgi:hypothetical protein
MVGRQRFEAINKAIAEEAMPVGMDTPLFYPIEIIYKSGCAVVESSRPKVTSTSKKRATFGGTTSFKGTRLVTTRITTPHSPMLVSS